MYELMQNDTCYRITKYNYEVQTWNICCVYLTPNFEIHKQENLQIE